MKLISLLSLQAASLLAAAIFATAAEEPVPRPSPEPPRLVLYYQTTHDSAGRPISLLPLVTEKRIALTHLIVCSFHLYPDRIMHLNDFAPHAPLFNTLWNETRILRSAGIKVMGMVGGAAPGSFTRQTLDGDSAAFERSYGQLRSAITAHDLDGVDLDMEQDMSQAGITRLGRRNLSGFGYRALETAVGSDISFYNAQFYNGFGDMMSVNDYKRIVDLGWDAEKIVVGQITSPSNGEGYVSHARLNRTIGWIRESYGEIGGIMGWEYFNSQPGGLSRPWEWAQVMTAILRPNAVPRLTVTQATAEMLIQAWKESRLAGAASTGIGTAAAGTPNIDYMDMVNA
ncbi:hypothetical protein VTK56DRAFT_6474 [Thermocarpiscus australiensis]